MLNHDGGRAVEFKQPGLRAYLGVGLKTTYQYKLIKTCKMFYSFKEVKSIHSIL